MFDYTVGCGVLTHDSYFQERWIASKLAEKDKQKQKDFSVIADRTQTSVSPTSFGDIEGRRNTSDDVNQHLSLQTLLSSTSDSNLQTLSSKQCSVIHRNASLPNMAVVKPHDNTTFADSKRKQAISESAAPKKRLARSVDIDGRDAKGVAVTVSTQTNTERVTETSVPFSSQPTMNHTGNTTYVPLLSIPLFNTKSHGQFIITQLPSGSGSVVQPQVFQVVIKPNDTNVNYTGKFYY